jgi:TctA family transporter
MEEALRQALGISQGSFAIFVERPISLVLLLATAASLTAPVVTWGVRRWLVQETS